MWPRIAALGRTAQFIFAIAEPADFHLTAVKFSFADNAKTLVVEGPPSSKSIFSTQDREPIIKLNVSDHCNEQSAPRIEARTIRARPDCVVGQNLMGLQLFPVLSLSCQETSSNRLRAESIVPSIRRSSRFGFDRQAGAFAQGDV